MPLDQDLAEAGEGQTRGRLSLWEPRDTRTAVLVVTRSPLLTPCRSFGYGLAGLVAASCLATTSPVQALEGEWHAGLGAGTAMARGEDSAWGPALLLDTGYDLSDSWQLRGTLTSSLHAFCANNEESCDRPTLRVAWDVGALYRLDVIEWVPYGGPLLGYRWLGAGTLPEPGAAHAMTLGWLIGVDYLLSRATAIGTTARYDGDIIASHGGPWETQRLTLALHLERRWGL